MLQLGNFNFYFSSLQITFLVIYSHILCMKFEAEVFILVGGSEGS